MINLKRITACVLACSLMLAETAWADTVATAESPSSSTETQVSSDGTLDLSSVANSGSNYISASGPGGASTEGTTVVINSSADESSVIGPGGTTAASSAESVESVASVEGAAQAAALLTIDGSITEPTVSSSSAILYDATVGQVLYEKNADTQLYPASTTKLMTALVTLDNLALSDTITFTNDAVNGLESGATVVNMAVGDTMTVEDALHAILIKSACDVAAGLAISISGSESQFAVLMNEKAAELGCTNTNFANATGLNDSEHLTTVRDMMLITKAALDNETIRTITQKYTYKLPATSSRSALTITNTNHFVSGGSDPLDGYLGGKTGYTSKAGQCLATGASVCGHELIAVVFKAQSPNQYSDSRALYEYGEEILIANGIYSGSSSSESSAESSGSSVTDGTWEVSSDGQMMYKKSDGTYLKSEWLDLGDNTYFFDSDGYMCTGWKKFSNGSWYYFNPENGAMVKSQWVTINNKSYYMQSNGVMATDTIIDGTYRVDENGVYVELVG